MQTVVPTPFGFSNLNGLDPIKKLIKHGFHFLLREARTNTTMHASSECEMVNRVTSDVKDIWLIKTSFISVCRSE